MSSASRLTELECPGCRQEKWVIDPDSLGREGENGARRERKYECRSCGYHGPDWRVGRQAPPAFLLQPHELYPMAQEEFDYWVEILRTHFPAHRLLPALGRSFVPYLPEQAAADRAAHARAYPVREMRDQDGARRIDPKWGDAIDWIDMMKPADTLALYRREGGALHITCDGATFSAACVDERGAVRAEISQLTVQLLGELSRVYLTGDVEGAVRLLRKRSAT